MIDNSRKQALVDSINKINAYYEIRNIMAEASEAFSLKDYNKLISFFCLSNKDAWVEIADEGKFIAKQGIEYILDYMIKENALFDIYLTTPIIEIANDFKTAKGVWWCPIPITKMENCTSQAIWGWGNIATDFIAMNDSWEILHLHYFRVFKCAYEKGWVDDLSMINRLNLPAHPFSTPCTYHNPYSPLSIRNGIPAAPRPYDSYDGPEWMTRTEKE